MTEMTHSLPMPMKVHQGHVAFDTAKIAPDTGGEFFQNTRWIASSGKPQRKTGSHTNITGGSFSNTLGVVKEFSAIRVVIDPRHDFPNDTKVMITLLRGSTPVLNGYIPVNCWKSLRQIKTGLVMDSLYQAETTPLIICATESFSINVTQAPASAMAKVEVRGNVWAPDFEHEFYTKWRANEIGERCVRPALELEGGALHDEETPDQDGRASFFADTRCRGDSSFKKYGPDCNLLGNGGRMPKGHVKGVSTITLEATKGDLGEGPLEVEFAIVHPAARNVLAKVKRRSRRTSATASRPSCASAFALRRCSTARSRSHASSRVLSTQ